MQNFAKVCGKTLGRYSIFQRSAGSFGRSEYVLERIGNREVVGYGMNGMPMYVDRAEFPFPAIRFKEPTPDVLALREKEKGDWRRLTVEEKKAIYRASYGQTFAEFQAPTGEWMEIVGYGLMWICVGIWLFMLEKLYVFPDLPDSFKEKNKRAQLRRQIDLHMNPITGLASKWDYEKNDWKRKTWFTPDNPFIESPYDAEDEEED